MRVRFVFTYIYEFPDSETMEVKEDSASFYTDRETTVIPCVGWRVEVKGVRGIVERVLVDYDRSLAVVQLEKIEHANLDQTWEEAVAEFRREWTES